MAQLPELRHYCEGALDYLRRAYDPAATLFSFRSTIDRYGSIVNDFDHPQTVRYTINTFLGLTQAERFLGPIDWMPDVASRVRVFLSGYEQRLRSHADIGLLLVLLTDVDPTHPAIARCLERIDAAISGPTLRQRLNMQDLAWMLWGATAAAGDPVGGAIAHRLFELIRTRYIDAETGLPHHSLARYRAHLLSFGSLVYFLRSVSEYGERFANEHARQLFRRGVQRALEIQAPDGAWPWMLDVRTGETIDSYPVFTVHQDSMAMLFLLPAQALGISGIQSAIRRSLLWNFGDNQLGVSLVRERPCFWIDRAIERDEQHARARRFLRSLHGRRADYPQPAARVRINRECRSYHLGWVLYAWASLDDVTARRPADDRTTPSRAS